MHAFDILGDPVRRRLVELLAEQPEVSAGELTETVKAEFGISQPAVSNHLKVLREAGFARSQRRGSRRWYALEGAPLTEVQEWVEHYTALWAGRLDALDTEIRRGRRNRGPSPAAPRSRTATPAAATKGTTQGTTRGSTKATTKGTTKATTGRSRTTSPPTAHPTI